MRITTSRIFCDFRMTSTTPSATASVRLQSLPALRDLHSALAAYRRALQIRPNYPAAQSNLLYLLYYHPESTPASLYEAHDAWATTVEATEDTENTEIPTNRNVVAVPAVSSVVS